MKTRSEIIVMRLAPGVRVKDGELLFSLPDGTVTSVPGNAWAGIARGTVGEDVAVQVARLPLPGESQP